MPTTALAALGALLAAACYATGAALQQQQAAATPGSGRLRLSLLARLARRPRWLAGLLVNAAGVGLHLYALSLAPLALVQPLGVMTIVFAVPVGALLRRRRPGTGELAGAGIVSAGLALLMTTLRGSAALPHLDLAEVGPLAGAVAALVGVATLTVRHAPGAVRTVVLGATAGAAMGLTSALLRPVLHGFAAGGVLALVHWTSLAVLITSVLGMLLEQSTFQIGRLGLAVAVITVVDPVAALVAGAAFLHQPVYVGSPAVAVVAISLVVAGVAVLSRQVRGRPGPAGRQVRPQGGPAEPYGPVATAGGLRVLVGADTYPPHVNGAAYFARNLAHGLAARGHEVHVVCPSPDGTAGVEADGPVRVHRVRSARTPFHPSFRIASPVTVRRDVARIVAAACPDVVHVQSHFLVGRALCRLARRRGLPLVATNHFMPENLLPYVNLPDPIARGLARLAWRDLARVFGGAWAVTAPTPRAAELVRAAGVGRGVEAVSNGVDLSRFTAVDGGRRPYGGTRTMLFVGRLDTEKHVDELVDALPLVRERVDARLVVAGAGGQREALVRRAAQRGVAGHVTFLGFVPDEELPSVYAGADVFCMPGTAELQSLVTLEAMAAGLPVVAADAMALPHLCQHGRNGYLHRPHDVAELARHVTTVLTDVALRAALGKESLAIAGEHDVAYSIGRFEAIYADVTGYPVRSRPLPLPSPLRPKIASL